MKAIACILSVYILVLIAIPCIDAPLGDTLQNVEQADHSNHNHNHENDHCSPFCSCQCCATPAVFQNYAIQFNCFLFVQKQFPGYSSSYISSLFVTIWQPPKIA